MSFHEGLFAGLFDDAAIFPPGNAPLPRAVDTHRAWLRSEAADAVGPFICAAGRLDELASLGADFPISVTVPDGPTGLVEALKPRDLDIVSSEVVLTDDSPTAWTLLRTAADQVTVYVEVALADLTADLATRLVRSGLRLKLRTGGTDAEKFPPAAQLAAGLVTAVSTGIAFKLTAGLHHALRHRDEATGFEHHGFANVLIAVARACRGGGVDEVAALLDVREADAVAEILAAFSDEEISLVRQQFTSFGTCSIAEPLDDLVALGLLPANFPTTVTTGAHS